MRRAFIRGILVVCFAMAAMLHSVGQVSAYPVGPAISGVVIGPCEEVISGVKVTVMGQPYSATTDENGVYRISVPPGSYSVEFVRSGFRTEIKNGVLVRPIGATEVGVQLTPTRGRPKGRNDPRCHLTQR